MRRDRRLDQVGEIFEIQSRPPFGPVLKRYGLCEFRSASKPGALRQQAWLYHPCGGAGILALKKGDDGFDLSEIGLLHRKHGDRFRRQVGILFPYFGKDTSQSGPAEEPEHHFDTQIGLRGVNITGLKEPGEIGSRRIGRIQLCQRRDKEQEALRLHVR